MQIEEVSMLNVIVFGNYFAKYLFHLAAFLEFLRGDKVSLIRHYFLASTIVLAGRTGFPGSMFVPKT